METTIFLDGDFSSNKGNCKYHCSPTCHPGQTDPNRWRYGCLHKAYPQNKYDDFVPLVDCDGDTDKCELKKAKKLIWRYKQGKSNSLNHAIKKVERLERELSELNKLIGT
jgi:hypothetical protein